MGCASSDDELDFEDEVPVSPSPVRGSQPPQLPSNAFNMPLNPQGTLGPDFMQFANMCCEDFGLSDSAKDDVLKSAKLPVPFLLIRLYSRLLALGQQIQHSTVASFLDSADFKEHITRRLQAGLLDPNILFYVRDTTERAVRHMTENPASYNIPLAVQSHFMHTKAFSQAVGTVLANTRGEFKRKLQKSISDHQDINTLCKKLAIRGYRLTSAHAQQISFLRMYLIQYNKATFPPDDARPSFWEYIDLKLEKLRQKSASARAKALEKNLKDDKDMFPVAAGAPNIPPSAPLPQWQTDVGIAMIAMAGYRIDGTSQSNPDRGELEPDLSGGRGDQSPVPHSASNGLGDQYLPDSDNDGGGAGSGKEDEGRRGTDYSRDGPGGLGDGIPAATAQAEPTHSAQGHMMDVDERAPVGVTPQMQLGPAHMDQSPIGTPTPRRGAAHEAIGPGASLRMNPLGPRPSGSRSSSRNATPADARRTGGANIRQPARTSTRLSTPEGTSGTTHSSLPHSTMATSQYDPTASETAMGTIGWT